MTANTATPLYSWPGKRGTVVVWSTDNGYIATSSAHHTIAPSSTNNPDADRAWIARFLAGRLQPGNIVSETVVFPADDKGRITSHVDLGHVNTHESHEDAMREVGYDPAPIPNDLPTKESPL